MKSALPILALSLAASWADSVGTKSPPTSGPGSKSATEQDPINMGTGEHYFTRDLIKLGGPLPLVLSLYYGSQMDATTKARHDGLPTKFAINTHGMLKVDLTLSRATVYLGDGSVHVFFGPGPTWLHDNSDLTEYQLKETTDYFYLCDPDREWVYLFRKETPSPTTQFARLVYLIDRNDNRLTFSYAPDPTQHGPTLVSDGLGRSLTFTYGSVSGGSGLWLQQVTDHTGRGLTFTHIHNPPDNASRVTLRSITDPLGHPITFAYQAGGDHFLTGTTLQRGNTPYTQVYGPPVGDRGVVSSQTDAYGNTTQIIRDLFDPVNQDTTRFTLVNPDSSRRSFLHTHRGRVMRTITDETGRQMAFTPTGSEIIAGATDRHGRTTSADHNLAIGKMIAHKDARGRNHTWNYTAQNQTFTNPDNAETVSFSFQHLTQVNSPDGKNRQFTYDAKGNILTSKDKADATTTYTYNSRGQPLSITNPLGGLVTLTYNAQGNLATYDDTDEGLASFAYDAQNRLSTITLPDATTVQFTYDANDRLLTRTDERGMVSHRQYDDNGNVTSRTLAHGTGLAQTTSFLHDLMDRLQRITDPTGAQTNFGFRYWNGLDSVTFADAQVAKPIYDQRRWLSGLTDEIGKTLKVSRDVEGSILGGESPAGRKGGVEVNELGYPVSLTDAKGNRVTLTRDAVERVTAMEDRLKRKITRTYDGEGRVLTEIWPVLGTTTYVRNGLGLITSLTDFRGQAWTFTYTAMGRMATAVDPNTRTWSFAYDNRGRLATVTHPDAVVETRTYDGAGGLLGRSFTGGLNLTFTRDVLGRVTATGSVPVAVAYDVRDQATNTAMHGGNFAASFDSRNRVKTVTYDGLMTVMYGYDARSLLTGVSDNLSGASMTFAYDDDRLLIRVTRSNGVATEYTRDANGMVTRIHHVGKADLNLTRDAEDQVLGLSESTVLNLGVTLANETRAFTYDNAGQPNAAGFSHDLRGRRAADPERTYTWDNADRLASVTRGAVTMTFDYTAEGDLASQTASGVTTFFAYNRALGGRSIVAEKVAGAYTRFHVRSPSGRLLYVVERPSNAPRFVHGNQVGSILFLTDAAGAVTDTYGYTPYGRAARHDGPTDLMFTWQGERGVRQIGSTDLFQVEDRVYDSLTGRTLHRHPSWREMLEEPREVNPYGFAKQNPLRPEMP